MNFSSVEVLQLHDKEKSLHKFYDKSIKEEGIKYILHYFIDRIYFSVWCKFLSFCLCPIPISIRKLLVSILSEMF